MPDRTVILGRYELDPVHLGRGAMGTVWGGHDKVLDRRVAIKLIRFPDDRPDPEMERRFDREAQVMAQLNHPGAPTIYDLGAFDDPVIGRRLFLVMEFVEGVTLEDVIAEHGPLPVGWAAAVGAQIAAVLNAAHDRGILHRDLKPSNLMVRRDGTVKVLDFGLAMLHKPEVSRLTQTGQILGTVSYSPPEQIRAGAVTPQSDLYALGCVLHELLTGEPVFTGPTEFSVQEQHIRAAPPAVRSFRSDVPRELDGILASLLAKRAEDRPVSAAAVHDQLMPYVTGVGHLPGVTADKPSAVRMYAHAVSRILISSAEAAAPAGLEENLREHSELSRKDLERAHHKAMSLLLQSRYEEVAALLASVAELAGGIFGADDPEVLDLRTQLANALFEGGDYLRAAAAYNRLAPDLARRYGPDDERTFRCRMQEAMCQAHLNDPELALRLLRDLLADQQRAYPPGDQRTLELRRQIGEMERRSGDLAGAHLTFAELYDELSRRFGRDHPATARVGESLAALEI
ncbi:serine/threonine-protein kinase [Microbispora sp. ZYX-F-249]|uniref:non-specific serine/threonine protein kinase n=1 Tax=Microbispora maris TaxID=3144104 RepID=A0ABV0AMH4_9ACTN